MKTVLFAFHRPSLPWNSSYVERITGLFGSKGVYFDEVRRISPDDELSFLKQLGEAKDLFDYVVIADGDEVNFNVNDCIARVFGIELEQNSTAKKFVDAFNQVNKTDFVGEYALLPEGAVVFPNALGARQGYLLETDDVCVVVLPANAEQAESIASAYALPYIRDKDENKFEIETWKLWGVKESELNRHLDYARALSGNTMRFNVAERYGDITLRMFYDEAASKTAVDNAFRYLAVQLKGKIYAETDISLQEQLFNLLSLRRGVLSTAESFTAGRIASAVISVPGASAVFHEGIVAYSNAAKEVRLRVSRDTLKEHGAVSRETAYEMALGLLDHADYAVATTGIAGPASDDTEKPVGLCYIAVGTTEGIHIHKFNFRGTREEITERAKTAALYLAVQLVRASDA